MGASSCSVLSSCGTIALPPQSKLAQALSSAGTGGLHVDEEGNIVAVPEDDTPGAFQCPKVAAKYQKEFVGRVSEKSTDDCKQQIQDQLIAACRAGDFRRTVEAISAGADIQTATLRGMTPLMFAATSNNLGTRDVLKFLIEATSKIDAQDVFGWTALFHACRNSRADTVEFLLESKASLKARACDGKTLLMVATLDGADALVMNLVSRKIPLDKKCDRGWSVLFYACDEDRVSLVKWLLKKQANLKDKAKDGTTALMVAAERGSNIKIAQALVKKSMNVNTKNDFSQTAVVLALKAGNEEFVEYLLTTNIDTSIKTLDQEDAVDIAERLGLHGLKTRLEFKARASAENKAADG